MHTQSAFHESCAIIRTLPSEDVARGEGIEGLRGTIRVGASSPFKYHEAFHAVFRMLLTDEEITKYLGIAKNLTNK